MIPLITSIPPRMSRIDATGNEIGAEYQRHCIESWRSAGFDPISVNSSREPAPAGVRVMSVERDAEHITGRPYAFLADLLHCGNVAALGGVFAIANADLMLAPELGSIAQGAARHTMILSRRVDVGDASDRHGTAYESGFDLFAMHGQDIDQLPDIGLIFGAPWWDHWLPILMQQCGGRLIQTEPLVYHLKHPIKWDGGVWSDLGQKFLSAATPYIGDRGLVSAHVAAGRTGGVIRRLASLAIPSRRQPQQMAQLSLVAAANTRFIDSISLIKPPSRQRV